jgi:hypothetical protein
MDLEKETILHDLYRMVDKNKTRQQCQKANIYSLSPIIFAIVSKAIKNRLY